MSVLDSRNEHKTFIVPVENVLQDIADFQASLLDAVRQLYPSLHLDPSFFKLKHMGVVCPPDRALDFFLLARDEPACFSLSGDATTAATTVAAFCAARDEKQRRAAAAAAAEQATAAAATPNTVR